MLCQKCGRQEAVVHLETLVFRQKVEEHLCKICAGAKAFLDQQVSKSAGSTASSEDPSTDSIRLYLDGISQTPPLSPSQESKLWKRLMIAEFKSKEILSHALNISTYFASLGIQLLKGEERFDRLVSTYKIGSRDKYIKQLSKLINTTKNSAASLDKAWATRSKKRSAQQHKKTLKTFETRARHLRARIQEFSYGLRIYEEYLETLRPVVTEIESLHAQLSSAEHGAGRPSAEKHLLKDRLLQIENQQRIAPLRLITIVRQATGQIRQAHLAKAKIVGAYLRLVIALAKGFINRGISYLELIQQGNAGLVRAFEMFEYRGGEKFSVFAAKFIILAIERSIED